jgi:hypothetical protein
MMPRVARPETPMKRLLLTLAAVIMITVPATADEPKPAADSRVFEMRTYHANPGKMAALHARFRDHTCKLFERHGMTVIGFWSPIDKEKSEEVLVYLLAFPSKEAADKSWKEFRDDPDWKKVKADSEKDGVLVKKVESVYLTGTDYSKLK